MRVGDGTPGPGRPKGIPNKATMRVKEALLKAFDDAGGAEYLLGLAQSDPRTFCALLAKLIPAEIKATIDGQVTLAQLVAQSYRQPDAKEDG